MGPMSTDYTTDRSSDTPVAGPPNREVLIEQQHHPAADPQGAHREPDIGHQAKVLVAEHHPLVNAFSARREFLGRNPDQA